MSHSSLIAMTNCGISYITTVGWGEVEMIEQVDCMKKKGKMDTEANKCTNTENSYL